MSTTRALSEVKFRHAMLRELATNLLTEGFNVYVTDWQYSRDEPKTYYHFEDTEGRVGYVQYDRLAGCLQFSTVHIPSVGDGTGFHLDDTVNTDTALAHISCKVHRPSWAKGSSVIKKWSSFAEMEKRMRAESLDRIQLTL